MSSCSAGCLDDLISGILENQLPNLVVQLPPVADEVPGAGDGEGFDALFFQDGNHGLCLSLFLFSLPTGKGRKCVGNAVELAGDVDSDLLRPFDLAGGPGQSCG